jgi:hypothetical protein
MAMTTIIRKPNQLEKKRLRNVLLVAADTPSQAAAAVGVMIKEQKRMAIMIKRAMRDFADMGIEMVITS